MYNLHDILLAWVAFILAILVFFSGADEGELRPFGVVLFLVMLLIIAQ